MKQPLLSFLAVGSILLVSVSAATAQHATMSDKDLMDKLQGAAPAAVIKDAAMACSWRMSRSMLQIRDERCSP